MREDLFNDLVDALEGAAAYESGAKLDLRVVELPPPPEPLSPEQIAEIRKRLRASQAVFAHLLNVSPSTVRAWEQGRREPNHAALKLLHIARERPDALVPASA
jgi:putative transcriptional regulator